MTTLIHEEQEVTTRTMTKTELPEWLLAFWKEIDDKTFGKGCDCFTEDAICNLGVADGHAGCPSLYFVFPVMNPQRGCSPHRALHLLRTHRE